MKNNDKFVSELEQELRSISRSDNADGLLPLARALSKATQPRRSAATHKQSWKNVKAYINSQRGPWYRLNWKFTLLPAGAFAAVACLLFFSQNALPGDPTYSIKKGGETLQLAVAFSDSQKAGICSGLMKARANELAKLPTERLSESTVTSLTDSIVSEAMEFEEYANRSSDKTALSIQRQRDASYVITALQTAKQNATGEAQSKAIDATIQAMQQILEVS